MLAGGYVWVYSMVLSGIVIGSIYVIIRIGFHTWKTPKTPKDQVCVCIVNVLC